MTRYQRDLAGIRPQSRDLRPSVFKAMQDHPGLVILRSLNSMQEPRFLVDLLNLSKMSTGDRRPKTSLMYPGARGGSRPSTEEQRRRSSGSI